MAKVAGALPVYVDHSAFMGDAALLKPGNIDGALTACKNWQCCVAFAIPA